MGRPTPLKVNGATFGRSCPPGVQLLPHFEVWSYRACQPLKMWQISHFSEIHSLSYEASKFLAMLSLCVFLGRYFAPGANIVPPIAYKSHSTPFPIRPHVLTPHSWLCDKNCGRSSATKKSGIWKWRITLMLPCHIWQAPLTTQSIWSIYFKLNSLLPWFFRPEICRKWKQMDTQNFWCNITGALANVDADTHIKEPGGYRSRTKASNYKLHVH